MVLYDEKEIARVFARIPCLGCSNWQADAVRAKVLAFLVARPLGWGARRQAAIARRPAKGLLPIALARHSATVAP